MVEKRGMSGLLLEGGDFKMGRDTAWQGSVKKGSGGARKARRGWWCGVGLGSARLGSGGGMAARGRVASKRAESGRDEAGLKWGLSG